MKYQLILSFALLTSIINAQVIDSPSDVVHKFFIAMNEVDTSYLTSVLHKDASLSSTMLDPNGKWIISVSSVDRFAPSVAKSLPGDLNEQISNLQVEIDGSLANLWMDYTFYYKGQLSHCGVNNFTMALEGERWKIISLSDTRKKESCVYEEEKNAINKLVDDWHLAATNADSISYFDLMTDNSIFIGTDKTEVWTKNQFLEFASPYFAKGKAWDFKKVSRNVYSSDFKELAWFDELIDTWMGPCRGSGVVVKIDGHWYLQHYVLSVTVPNDDIKEFLKIYEK